VIGRPENAVPRLLCLIGSGEMSPAMVSLHADLMSRVASPPNPAAMLDTTYGFQENADDLSAKAQRYFAAKVGHPIGVERLRDLESIDRVALERVYKRLREAHYIFAGPGSPSYTVRQWRRSLVPQVLGERLTHGGCITLASAAAMTIGRLAVPVYEIYKVGESPHWIDGLDLLRPLGLDLAIITHYDNQEGGTHDTRYCYLGERRLQRLEQQLPAGLLIFGVAEQTAAIFDFDADTLEVRGRGFAVARRHGIEDRFEAGRTVSLSELRQPEGQAAGSEAPPAPQRFNTADWSLTDLERQQRDFAELLGRAAFEEAAALLLQLDTALETENGPVPVQVLREAHSIFRGMLLQFGEGAQRSAVSREPLARIAEITGRLRDQARRDHRYSDADRLREALRHLGIEVRDGSTLDQ
jgi:hypothetical protein